MCESISQRSEFKTVIIRGNVAAAMSKLMNERMITLEKEREREKTSSERSGN